MASRTTLKSYFETGDIPTQSQFQSLIDSTFNLTDDTKSTIGLGNVENTALSAWAGSSNILTVGTIGTGVWQGTAIANAYIASGLDAAKIANGSVSNTEFQYLDGVTSALQTQLNAKQATLVSGTNIKTINSTSLLGSGDIVVSASISGTDKQVLFFDGANTPAGNAGLTFAKSTGTLTINQGASFSTGMGLVVGATGLLMYSNGTQLEFIIQNQAAIGNDGANLYIQAQQGSAGHIDGNIILGGPTNNNAIMDIGGITGGDKTFRWPNATGTLALTSNIHGAVFCLGRGSTTGPPANETTYADTSSANIVGDAGDVMPFSGTLQKLYVDVWANDQDTGSTVYTLRKNGVNTAITVTVNAGVVTVASDTTHTVSVSAGDIIDLKAVATGTTGGQTISFSYVVI